MSIAWDHEGIPTMASRYEGKYPCRLCNEIWPAGAMITKRWGVWLHADCYKRMTAKERWELTQRINKARSGG